eukprot:1147779-Pelagomonas_calceolata.AAC.1
MLPFNNYNTLCPSFYSASSSSPQSSFNLARHLACSSCLPAFHVFSCVPSARVFCSLSLELCSEGHAGQICCSCAQLVCPPCNWTSPIERAGRELPQLLQVLGALEQAQ